MKYIMLFAASLLMIACQNSQEYYEGVYIVGAQGINPTATLTVDDLPSAIGVNVASSNVVEEDMTVEMEVRKDLVEHYNSTYKKNYQLLPESTYEVENKSLMIQSGKHASSNGLRLKIISREGLEEGVTYLLPISISHISNKDLSIIEGARTIYVVVNQIIITQAADLDATWRYYKVDFRTASKYDTKALKSVTFEARIRCKKIGIRNKWCFSVMGLEENLCVRLGGSMENGYKVSFSGGTDYSSNDLIPNDKWVHVACVYDGDAKKKITYVNGVYSGEMVDDRNSWGGVCDLTYAYGHDKNASFYIGQSASDNRYLEGYISEVRVWGVARTAVELKNNVCWVDPLSEGLIAYWRFNGPAEEGSNEVTDLTGNGYNAVYAYGNPVFVDGVRCPDN